MWGDIARLSGFVVVDEDDLARVRGMALLPINAALILHVPHIVLSTYCDARDAAYDHESAVAHCRAHLASLFVS